MPAPPSAPTSTADHPHGHEAPEGPVQATVALEPNDRARLGLPALPGTAIDPAALPPLDEDQWADPEVVAARLVRVRTNYRADDDPETLRLPSSPYVVPRFDAELASSSGGQAGLGQLQAQDTVFAGDVVGLVTSERSDNRSVVDLTVRRSTARRGTLVSAQVSFWRVTLVREPASGHWQVAGLELS